MSSKNKRTGIKWSFKKGVMFLSKADTITALNSCYKKLSTCIDKCDHNKSKESKEIEEMVINLEKDI